MKLILSVLVLAFLLTPFYLSAQKETIVIKSGHIDSADIYKLFYVPIEIPKRTGELKVELKYSDKGKNVLNLGIYDIGGYEMGVSAGFRGWSGGAKTEFFIQSDTASTGYIPGKIPAGTWNILIYSSTIIKKGIDWEIKAILIDGKPKNQFQISKAKTVIHNKSGWYRGDLHMHTLHSDGKRSQQELVDEALDKKMDYIISTEHNTNSANLYWGKYNHKNLLVINGEEITTTAFGHWNAIGLNANTLIEWRFTPEDNLIRKYIDKVHQDGGLCIINHPFYAKGGANNFEFDPNLFDGIEIWNGNWDKQDELALNWWDSLLKEGKKLFAIGASDTHVISGSENNLGSPQTVIFSDALSKKGLMEGLKNGKAYAVKSSDFELVMRAKSGSNEAMIGETLKIDLNDGTSVSLSAKLPEGSIITLHSDYGIIQNEIYRKDKIFNWTVKMPAKYVRAEVRSNTGELIGFTNPIYILLTSNNSVR
jgi:hypothetical protein